MNKAKISLIFALVFLPLFAITVNLTKPLNSSARQLTKEERKFYAQNNIIFTVPCDSEADCAQNTDPSDPTDPTTPTTPENPVDPTIQASTSAGKIVEVAIKASWPVNGQCKDTSGSYINWSGPRKDQACSSTTNDYAALIQSNSGVNTLRDCGKFVGSVIRYAGIDPSFPTGGVISQMNHMESSQKWTKVSTDGIEYKITNLQPGDILAYTQGKAAGASGGHIMIYIGSKTATSSTGQKFSVNIASASLNHWTPQLNKMNYMSSDQGKGIPYSVYRFTGD